MTRKNDFVPLFVKKNTKKLFKQEAALKNKTMADYFDDLIYGSKNSCFSFDIYFNKPNKIFKNKKGNVILDISLVLLVLGCIILALLYLGDFNDTLKEFVESDDSVANETKQVTLDQYNNFEKRNDASILIIFGFLWLTVIASSFLVDAHPIFFVVSLVLLIGLLTSTMYFGNMMEETFNNEFSSDIPKYPYMYWIATHMLEILLSVAATIFISLFAKRRFLGE